VSRDRGQQWESLSATLPSTPVHDLAVQSRAGELVIGTYGRGAWVLDLGPIRERSSPWAVAPLYLFPVRDVVQDWFPWETVPGDRRGRRVARLQVATTQSGTAAITVADSSGRVVRRWSAELTPGVNTLVWDLQVETKSAALDDAPAGSYVIDVGIGQSRAAAKIVVLPDPILKPRPRSP
jgi:hypothetical protein